MKFLIIWEQSITYSDNYEVKCFMEQTHAGMEEIERVSMNLPSLSLTQKRTWQVRKKERERLNVYKSKEQLHPLGQQQ